jgi:hypothetical protein
MIAASDPRRNHLIAALPSGIFQRWVSDLVLVPMPQGKVLYEAGETSRYVYFPTTAIASLLYVMEDGASAEIAIVGNDRHGRRVLVYGRWRDLQPRASTERR